MERRPAVIFDRDGTLAQINRDWPESGDWASYNAAIPFDNPVPAVVALTRAVRPDIDVIVVSGRDGAHALAMRAWLDKHEVRYDRFFMRRPGDRRRDSVVKAEILDHLIAPRWRVLYAVDDRPQVIEMWRSRRIPVLAVTNPNPDRMPLFAGLGGDGHR